MEIYEPSKQILDTEHVDYQENDMIVQSFYLPVDSGTIRICDPCYDSKHGLFIEGRMSDGNFQAVKFFRYRGDKLHNQPDIMLVDTDPLRTKPYIITTGCVDHRTPSIRMED